MEKVIGEYQSGFRGGRSVVDQIFIIRKIQTESTDHNLELFVAFIDFQQVYDGIERK